MVQLRGRMGLAHCRYPTAGGAGLQVRNTISRWCLLWCGELKGFVENVRFIPKQGHSSVPDMEKEPDTALLQYSCCKSGLDD